MFVVVYPNETLQVPPIALLWGVDSVYFPCFTV